MGILSDIAGKIKNEISYGASSEASSAIRKGAEKLFKKGEKAIKCPKCKSPITQGVKFCPKCGTKLVVTCLKCNVEYPIGTKFCGQCGETLK